MLLPNKRLLTNDPRAVPASLERASYPELELSPRRLYDGRAAMEDVPGWLHDTGFLLSLGENVASDGRSGRALQITAVFTRT